MKQLKEVNCCLSPLIITMGQSPKRIGRIVKVLKGM